MHWPHREWCKCCVLGRCKEKPHHRADRQRDCPQVFLDFCFVVREGESSPATLLVLAEVNVQEKGPASYPTEICCRTFRIWDVKEVVLICDQEQAILALCQAIASAREKATVIQPGPKYDPKSTGYIVATNSIVEGLLRVYAASAEARYRIYISSETTLLPRLCSHVGWVLTRFAVKKDVLTSYWRRRGRWKSVREQALRYRRSHHRGVVGPGDLAVLGAPWEPRASLQPAELATQARYFTRAIIDRLGRLVDCPASAGAWPTHSNVCRDRLEGLLKAEGEKTPSLARGEGNAPVETAREGQTAPAAASSSAGAGASTSASHRASSSRDVDM